MRLSVGLLLMALAAGAQAKHACFDPGDGPGARYRLQDEPCRWPMVAAPLPEATKPVEPQRGASFRRESPTSEPAPEFFWRLPWRGYPPHSAPSALQWR
jgi:hypothetical protein